MKAKAELALNLTNFQLTKWNNEPVIPIRHISSRDLDKPSGDWVKDKSRKGYQLIIKCVLQGILIISLIIGYILLGVISS